MFRAILRFWGVFLYGASTVKFDITCTLPIPLNIRRCAHNFLCFFLIYRAPLFEGTPWKNANSAPQVLFDFSGYRC